MELEDVRDALIKYLGKDYLPGLGSTVLKEVTVSAEQVQKIIDILKGVPVREVSDAEVEVPKEEETEAEG